MKTPESWKWFTRSRIIIIILSIALFFVASELVELYVKNMINETCLDIMIKLYRNETEGTNFVPTEDEVGDMILCSVYVSGFMLEQDLAMMRNGTGQ